MRSTALEGCTHRRCIRWWIREHLGASCKRPDGESAQSSGPDQTRCSFKNAYVSCRSSRLKHIPAKMCVHKNQSGQSEWIVSCRQALVDSLFQTIANYVPMHKCAEASKGLTISEICLRLKQNCHFGCSARWLSSQKKPVYEKRGSQKRSAI